MRRSRTDIEAAIKAAKEWEDTYFHRKIAIEDDTSEEYRLNDENEQQMKVVQEALLWALGNEIDSDKTCLPVNILGDSPGDQFTRFG
jgi:hypothetical protein